MALDDPEAVRELFSSYRSVQVRRMFGGHGIFAEGLMFALELGGEIYLKADGENIPRLKAEGSEPFVYRARSREIALSYWKLPERLYDEPEELATFARDAFAAAARGAAKKAATKKAKAVKRTPAKKAKKKSKRAKRRA